MSSGSSALTVSPEAPSAWTEGLEPRFLAGIIHLRDWLVTKATHIEDAGEVLTGFAERLNALGLPIDRIFTAIEALHSEYAGIGRSWTREEGASVRLLPHGERRQAST